MRSVAILLTLLVCLPARAETNAGSCEVEAISRARIEAYNRRDANTMSRLISPNLIVLQDNGAAGGAADVVAAIQRVAPADNQQQNPRDYRCAVAGNVAVLTYIYEEREKFPATDIVSVLSALETWVQASGNWVLVAKSATPVPVNRRPAIPIDPSRLREYVGRYEWRPGMLEDVTLDGDHLVSKMNGEPPTRIDFVAPDVQVSRDDFGEARVHRDASGRVTGYSYIKPDGQVIEVRRIE